MANDQATFGLDGAAPTQPGHAPEPEVEWRRTGLVVLGPLLTLATAIAFDLLARRGVPIPNPVPLLLLAVVFAALRGGPQPALISALISILYGVHYFSDRGPTLEYTSEGALSLIALAIAAPAIALLVARERRGEEAVEPAGQAGIAGRHGVLAEASRRLSLTTEIEETLQSVARVAVPVLGDGCLVQLFEPDGTLRCAGSAHRHSHLELATRALCERGWPARGGAEAGGPEVITEGSGRWDALSTTEEQRGLAGTLGAASLLAVPLAIGERRVGRMVFVRDGSRPFAPAEIADVGELARRTALSLDHARLARAARDAEERYRLLFQNNPQPMWVFDAESLAFLDVNDAATRYYGYTRDEFLRMTIMDLRPPDDVPTVFGGLERSSLRRPGVALAQHVRSDGSLVDVEIVSHELDLGGRPARLVLATDVTERARTMAALHQSEDQLRHAQRMDAAARLAGGIAHDFSNLLTAIQGYSELLLRDLPPEDSRRPDVEEIRRAADRGALLTRQLLAFGTRQPLEPRPVDLNATIGQMETLIQRLVGAETRLTTLLSPRLGRVLIDPGQIEQVLVSLVLNARDAMPRGGELTIETTERRVSGGAGGRYARPGRYVVVTVSDSGEGVGPDASRASALGLSIVYGIVKQNGGVLRVLSDPERGTSVKVYLPRHEEAEPAEPEEVPGASRGGETVLVVEDEEGVREMLRKVLSRNGYRVLEARHGKDALLEAERHEGPIHLLVTDVVMPEMGGRELVRQLLPQRADLRVIYISGYTNDEIERRGMAESGFTLVPKPFTSDQFMQRVRAVLDAPPPAAAVEASGSV